MNMPFQNTEAMELIRILSLYRCFEYRQVKRFFPHLKEETLQTLLKKLKKMGKLHIDKERELILLDEKESIQYPLLLSLWVLLDFLPKITFHTISEYPVLLSFFTDGEGYDIIYIPEDGEMLLNHLLATSNTTHTKRLVIIESSKQISQVTFPGILAFCMVDRDGTISYYKRQT